jgi:hypothetical protein
MEVYGKVYRKADANRWVCVSNIDPIIFGEIAVEETDDQLIVAEKILQCVNKLGCYNHPSRTESFLSQDMIQILVEFVDKEEFESKLIACGKPDRPLYRRGGMEFLSDVACATRLPLFNER